MCVIDQTIAFMGGLDLCFGRSVSCPRPLRENQVADTQNIDGILLSMSLLMTRLTQIDLRYGLVREITWSVIL